MPPNGYRVIAREPSIVLKVWAELNCYFARVLWKNVVLLRISEVSSLSNSSCISFGVKFTLTPLSRYDVIYLIFGYM